MLEKLFDALADLNYETFAILLPGVLAVALAAVFLVVAQDLNAVEAMVAAEAFYHQHTVVAVALFACTTYFSGHTLAFIGRDEAVRHWRWLLWRGRTVPTAARSAEIEPLWKLSREAVARFAPSTFDNAEGRKLLEAWEVFFPVARVAISATGRRSLLATYQNKYSLHRSISTALALVAWLAFATALGFVAGAAVQWHEVGAWVLPRWVVLRLVLMGAIAGPLSMLFYSHYREFWVRWGDAVIVESSLVAPSEERATTNG